jgi:hypothetical protein
VSEGPASASQATTATSAHSVRHFNLAQAFNIVRLYLIFQSQNLCKLESNKKVNTKWEMKDIKALTGNTWLSFTRKSDKYKLNIHFKGFWIARVSSDGQTE